MISRARRLTQLSCSLAVLACASAKESSFSPTGSSSGAGGGNVAGAGGAGGTSSGPCTSACADFPATPVSDGYVGSAAQIFAATDGDAGGPCIVEPQAGTLFPKNWLRPRFKFTAPEGHDLFEIRLQAANQVNDLVVYTSNPTWTMPKPMWRALAAHTQDRPITVRVRSARSTDGVVAVGEASEFTIASVAADGKVVYWSTTGVSNGPVDPSTTLLSGFGVGDESVVQVLTPSQVASATWQTWKQDKSGYQNVSCIGCHTATPDGTFISFNNLDPGGVVLASGATGMAGQKPSYVMPGGYQAIIQPGVGMTAFSAGHWAGGPPSEHLMVAALATKASNDQDQQSGLAWFDLESAAPGQNLPGAAWGWIYQPAAGSGLYATAPSWSQDGAKVVFTMTSSVVSGRLGTGTAHLYQVAFGRDGRQTPTRIPGDGSAEGYAQYYGTLSPDDALIAYNEIPESVASSKHPDLNTMDTGQPGALWDGMYAQPASELAVLRADGSGSKQRLKANDPPSCPGQPTSPGINNSWAKWSPAVGNGPDGKVYWIIFSSWRAGERYPNGAPIAQLYMTAVVVGESGIRSFPAVYLWNQPANLSNHTPAWDVFQIPKID